MSANGNAILEGTITLLSTDIAGSTLLNQALGDDVSATIERKIKTRVLEQISKHGGTVIKDTGDGLMVAFRSARRAVSCAQELQRAIARDNQTWPEADIQLRIGLHTGEVLSENGDLRGETVIVTKRTEEVAPPGGIFVSETVYGVLGTARSELEDRGKFDLKGISEPRHLYEAAWREEGVSGVLAPNEPTPFVGRSTEFNHLTGLASSAKDASGSMVLIGGEAGIGKTRLIDEVAREARRLGLLVLEGHCLDMESSPPYLPIIEAIEHAARIVDPDAFREALGDNAPEVAKLLPDLRQRYPDIPDPVELPPEQERRYLLHGVCEYIDRAAKVQPMMLIYEDLHWADESTLLFLRHLVQRLDEIAVLVVGTYRHAEIKPDSPLEAALPNLLRQKFADEIILKRFSEESVAAILEGRSGIQPPPELVSLVYSETEGNPFFTEEVFSHLYQAGRLFDENGSFKSGIQITDTEVPRGVRLIISRRLQNVSKECRHVLTRAAALGNKFDYNIVALLSGLDEEVLLDALDEAEDANIIRDVSSGREARGTTLWRIRRELLRGDWASPLSGRCFSGWCSNCPLPDDCWRTGTVGLRFRRSDSNARCGTNRSASRRFNNIGKPSVFPGNVPAGQRSHGRSAGFISEFHRHSPPG